MSTTFPIPERSSTISCARRASSRGRTLSISTFSFPFGGNLEREFEIIGRINRVSEDRNHVQIEIFHVERNVPAAMTARGDEAALKAK